MSQFYHSDTSTQPTPVVNPGQSWQAPQYPPPPSTYYPPQPLAPSTQPASPPKKRMRLDSKIAISIIVVLVLAVSLVAAIAFAVGNNTQSQANQDATATTNTANIAATNGAEQNATNVAAANNALSNDLTEAAMTPTVDPTPPQPSPTPQSDIGSTQQADVWATTLNSIKEGPGDGYLPPQPGNIYLYFNPTVQNTDASNHLISVIDFSVTDSDGNKYGFGEDSNYQDLSGTVVAGQKLRGWIIFEVSKSAHSFTLQFNPSFDPNQAVQ